MQATKEKLERQVEDAERAARDSVEKKAREEELRVKATSEKNDAARDSAKAAKAEKEEGEAIDGMNSEIKSLKDTVA